MCESGLRKVGLCGIHPLTRRYIRRLCNEEFRV
ncbi:hypothetical protein OC521_22320 [Vibrio vulnificus]|nr:hypothetical protein [Vibrio vulnificus]